MDVWFRISLFGFLLCVTSACRKEAVNIVNASSYSLGVEDFYALALDSSENHIVVAGGKYWNYGFIAESFDAGNTWDTFRLGDDPFFAAAFGHNGAAWCAGYNGDVWYKSPNNTQPWSFMRSYVWFQFQGIAPLNNETDVILGGGASYRLGMITRLNDFGTIDYARDSFDAEIRSLLRLKNNNCVAGAFGLILLSENEGERWTPVHIPNDLITDLWQAKDSERVWALGLAGSLHFSDDSGKTWTRSKRSGFFKTAASAFAITGTPDGKQMIIAGENDEVKYSDNGGDKWVTLTGLPENVRWRDAWSNAQMVYLTGFDGNLVRFEWPK